MFSIKITSIGKQKNGPEAELVSRYLKQIKSHAKVEIQELSESKHARSGDLKRARSEDAESLRSALLPGAKHILLTEHGTNHSSPDFAKTLQGWSENETTPIQFLLAGPHGVDTTLEKEAHATLSLSPMTFPHDIARALLLEQIYRAMTILSGKKYHY
jgi:23S rRNA (pseudouridine1915-N3)-methyltransferase